VTPDVLDRVRAGALLASGAPVLVLLSGGRDSVCLLDVTVQLSGRGSVRALHVNYGLRGGASDGDEAACRELCARLEVPLDVCAASRPGDAPGNLQAWARDVRYGAATRLTAANGALIAAAHTQTDQVETILYRLAASPGRRALLGMEPRAGRLVRPLLGVTREETAAWCRSRGLAWREDASNEDEAFARTRVREGLVPALREVHPQAEANVLRTAALLRDEAAVLDEVVDTALAGRDHISLEHLARLPPGLARLIVRRLAEGATGRSGARAAARLADVLALDHGAASLDLGDGARAEVRDGLLRFARTP
jgi:tRNA(Ile)-lysidine synthase